MSEADRARFEQMPTDAVAVHYPLETSDLIPRERHVVACWVRGSVLPFCGYIRYAAGDTGCPYFVVYHGGADGRTAEVLAWYDWQAATAAEREQREGETLIDFRLRTDPEYCRLFIKESNELATAAERERAYADGYKTGWVQAGGDPDLIRTPSPACEEQ